MISTKKKTAHVSVVFFFSFHQFGEGNSQIFLNVSFSEKNKTSEQQLCVRKRVMRGKKRIPEMSVKNLLRIVINESERMVFWFIIHPRQNKVNV